MKNKVLIAITTYNRPDFILRLLKQIKEQSKGYDLKLLVYNDNSNLDYSEVVNYLIDNLKYEYIVTNINHGKKLYYQLINELFNKVRNELFDYFIQLPDDVTLVDRFFETLINQWENIQDDKKVSLNPLVINELIGKPNMTGIIPVNVDYNNIKYRFTQWVDLCFITDYRFFNVFNIQFPNTYKNKMISSGVGRYLSNSIHNRGYNMYQCFNSLLKHGDHESKMHKEVRKKHPLNTYTRPFVTGGVATIPDRTKAFRDVVNSILPQVDKLIVYLNCFNGQIPEYLKGNDKIEYYESEKEAENITIQYKNRQKGDLTDTGKFYKVSEAKKGYYFSIDDDLIYPANYVDSMISELQKYDNKIVCSYHGRLYGKGKVSTYYQGKLRIANVLADFNQNMWCNVLGTGVMAFHTDTINIDYTEFKEPCMADIWFGIAAQKQNIPMLVLAHNKGYIKQSKEIDLKKTIAGKHLKSDKLQTDIFNSITWEVNIPPSELINKSKSILNRSNKKCYDTVFVKVKRNGLYRKYTKNDFVDAEIKKGRFVIVSQEEFYKNIKNQ